MVYGNLKVSTFEIDIIFLTFFILKFIKLHYIKKNHT